MGEPAIKHFRLGWISEPLAPEHRKHMRQPTIPYLTTSGRAIWLRTRKRGNIYAGAKYLPIGNDSPMPGVKVHLYNAMQAMPTTNRRGVVVCEGEIDAISAWQAGYKAVGVPGARLFRTHWMHLFRSALVMIAYDGDDAGQEAQEDLAAEMRKHRIRVETAQVPEGRDLNDLWLERGVDGLRELLGDPV